MKTGNDNRPVPAAKTAKPFLNPELEDIQDVLESTIDVGRGEGELFLGWGDSFIEDHQYEEFEEEFEEEDSW